MTIRWGIIGCGRVCEVKSGPALYKAAGSEVSIVMRRHRGLAEDFARRHGIRRFTDDAAEVIADPTVDAVYVATRPDTHADYARAVAAARKPCLVEKPMARSAVECRRMLEAFAVAERPLFVAYYRRALPRFVQLNRLLSEGAIGKVVSVHHTLKKHAPNIAAGEPVPWRFDAASAGGGLFLDLGSHVFDLLDFLFGPIADVSGYAVNRDRSLLVEDTVVAAFRFESGVLGSVSHQFASGIREDKLEVVGESGQISCTVFGDEPLELCNSEGSDSVPVEHPAHVHLPLVETIVAELSGGPACPSRADSALRTAAVMDKILDGYYGGRDDEFWARPATWPGRRAIRTPG